jgi:hypothetical protein
MRAVRLTGAALLLLVLSWPAHADAQPRVASPAWPTVSAATSATAAIDTLDVKGRAPKTGFSREAFGPEWKDVNGNGCDTRNDILRRDLRQARVVDGCVVLSGLLAPDPYTGRRIAYVHGHSTVDIDHVVALSDAWQKGAYRWTESHRTAFANDPLNLLAVDYSANRQKGDGDAATWLPSSRAYWCPFVARQVAVKVRYGLWVTVAEKATIKRVLLRCPAQPLPR